MQPTTNLSYTHVLVNTTTLYMKTRVNYPAAQDSTPLLEQVSSIKALTHYTACRSQFKESLLIQAYNPHASTRPKLMDPGLCKPALTIEQQQNISAVSAVSEQLPVSAPDSKAPLSKRLLICTLVHLRFPDLLSVGILSLDEVARTPRRLQGTLHLLLAPGP